MFIASGFGIPCLFAVTFLVLVFIVASQMQSSDIKEVIFKILQLSIWSWLGWILLAIGLPTVFFTMRGRIKGLERENSRLEADIKKALKLQKPTFHLESDESDH